MKQLLLDLSLENIPTLENFIPGRNVELLHALNEFLATSSSGNFIYCWGGSGSGKSHLLKSVCEACIRLKRYQVAYFACDQDTEFGLNDDLPDCIIVDDVDQLGAEAQIKLFNLYNQARDDCLALFLVSGKTVPAQLQLRQDVITRLSWGLVYQIHELTDEEKGKAMKNHAVNNGFELPEEVCDYLLHYEKRDMPYLIKMIDALGRYSLMLQRPITLPLLRQFLHEVL